MSDQSIINLKVDPGLKAEIEHMRALVPNAGADHVLRAAVLYFLESSAKYEREVYIREQLEAEPQLASAPETKDTVSESPVKLNYTAQEWVQVVEALIQAPLFMTVSVGQPGMFKTIKEVAALASGIKALSKDKYKQNRLIQSLLADFGQIEQSMGQKHLSYDEALATVRTAAEIVDRAASSEEAQGYRQFIIDLTEHVANAAGEGFMGTGERVSRAETAYINHLKVELGFS